MAKNTGPNGLYNQQYQIKISKNPYKNHKELAVFGGSSFAITFLTGLKAAILTFRCQQADKRLYCQLLCSK